MFRSNALLDDLVIYGTKQDYVNFQIEEKAIVTYQSSRFLVNILNYLLSGIFISKIPNKLIIEIKSVGGRPIAGNNGKYSCFITYTDGSGNTKMMARYKTAADKITKLKPK